MCFEMSEWGHLLKMFDHNQTVEYEVAVGFLKREKKNKASPKSGRACVFYGTGEGSDPLN